MIEKKDQLIENAVELFSRHGVISVTMDDLAKFAGVSKKTVYQFFENKAVLVEAVIDVLIDRSKLIITANLHIARNPVEELILQRNLFKKWISLRIIFNDVMLKRFPRAHRTFLDFKTNYLKEVIQTNLAKGIAEGFYFDKLDLPGIADIYVSVTDDFIFHSIKTYDEVCTALQLFINGISTANARSLAQEYNLL